MGYDYDLCPVLNGKKLVSISSALSPIKGLRIIVYGDPLIHDAGGN